MSDAPRKDYVTWLDVDIMLDHMRINYGLVGTVEFYRAEGKNGRAISKVGITWKKVREDGVNVYHHSLHCDWPTRGYKSVPALLCFQGHRDEDLYLKQVGYMAQEQLALPF